MHSGNMSLTCQWQTLLLKRNKLLPLNFSCHGISLNRVQVSRAAGTMLLRSRGSVFGERFVSVKGSHEFAENNLLSYLDKERLVKSLIYEADHGFSNSKGKLTRFSDFLVLQISSFTASYTTNASKSTFYHTIVLDAKSYDHLEHAKRVDLLDRVSQLLGYHGIEDLIEHEQAVNEATEGFQKSVGNSEAYMSISTPQLNTTKTKHSLSKETIMKTLQGIHPSIVIGSSEPVEMFTTTREIDASVDMTDTFAEIIVKNQSANMDILPLQPIENVENDVLHSVSFGKARELLNDGINKDKASEEQAQSAIMDILPRQSIENAENDVLHSVSFGKARELLNDGINKDKASKKEAGFEVKEENSSIATGAVEDGLGLDMPMRKISCLNASQISRLEDSGFFTLRGLLCHFPRTYINFERATQKVEDGQNLTLFGSIVSSRGVPLRSSLGLVEVKLKCVLERDSFTSNSQNTVYIYVKKFFYGSQFANSRVLNKIASGYTLGCEVAVSGKVKALQWENHFEIKEHKFTLLGSVSQGKKNAGNDKPFPVYPAKGELQHKVIESCIYRVVQELPTIIDPLPAGIKDQYQLYDLRQAYVSIHMPHDSMDVILARKRLVFDEFFYFQLGLLLGRQELTKKYLSAFEKGIVAGDFDAESDEWSSTVSDLISSLPYELTSSQLNAAREIICDLKKPTPMNRLLQGDVGAGKTIVAFLSLLEVSCAGYQGAFMAPTELLANQHYNKIISWLENLKAEERPTVALLTGSVNTGKANAIRNGLENGNIKLVVGTHSLISQSVKFAALGLVVIDEQHRFGVNQRERFKEVHVIKPIGPQERTKAIVLDVPHILAMSATPIPRSLALALHGDMDMTKITEMPAGRSPTTTYALCGETGRSEAYDMVGNELRNGGQVFVICPVIEESERQLASAIPHYDTLSRRFEDFKCGLAHGQMTRLQRDTAMQGFIRGETKLLVSTTIVEVGIDIPQASLIVIENAEMFGLAQLHQLRGRVGRGDRKSSCILLTSSSDAVNRLKILEESPDGFYLADMDLKIRGPGELLGKRQSGNLPNFTLARLEEDGDILEQARSAAEEVVAQGIDKFSELKREISMHHVAVTWS